MWGQFGCLNWVAPSRSICSVLNCCIVHPASGKMEVLRICCRRLWIAVAVTGWTRDAAEAVAMEAHILTKVKSISYAAVAEQSQAKRASGEIQG